MYNGPEPPSKIGMPFGLLIEFLMANGFGKPEDTGEKTYWTFSSLSDHSFRKKRSLAATFTAEGVRAVVVGRNSGQRFWLSLAVLFFDGEEHGDVWRALFKGKFLEFDRMESREARKKYIEHARETVGFETNIGSRRREFQRWGGLAHAELKALLERQIDMPAPKKIWETPGREKEVDTESARQRDAARDETTPPVRTAKAREAEEEAKSLGPRSGSVTQSFDNGRDYTDVVERRMSGPSQRKARQDATHVISNSPHKREEARPIIDQKEKTVREVGRQDPRKVRQSSAPLDISGWRKKLLDREEFDPNSYRDWPDEEETRPEIEEDEEDDGQ